jgi:hypothetical protein
LHSEGQKNVDINRITSDHSKDRSRSQNTSDGKIKTLDVLKIQSHSLQKTTDGDRIIYDFIEDIDKYQEEYHSYESNLAKVQDDLEASRRQLAQWQEQMSKHKDVFNKGNQVLDKYSDPQRCQGKLNKYDAYLTPLLEEHRNVQKEMVRIKKEIDELGKTLQEYREGLLALWCFGVKEKAILRSHAKQLNERFKDLKEIYLERRSKILYHAPILPTTKVHAWYKNCSVAAKSIAEIEKAVDKELEKYREVRKNGTISLPGVAKITQWLDKVEQIQLDPRLSSHLPELEKKKSALITNAQQLCDHAIATQKALSEHYDYLKFTYKDEIFQERLRFYELTNKLWRQLSPSKHNPFYLMEHVISMEDVNIDSTLPGPCGIKATRRGLSKLGIDIEEDATEDKIARLVEHSEEGTLFKDSGPATRISKISKAYQDGYGFDYISIDPFGGGVVTIEDIERITQKGHVVHAAVYSGVGNHGLLIEGVTRTENGDHVTFYDPYNDKKVTLPYQELEKVLTDQYTIPSEEQMKTREPILKRE